MLKEKYTIKDFVSLIAIFAGISAVALYFFSSTGMDVEMGMRAFMGGFFLVFGLLKLLKLHAFAEAYQMYDVLAKRSLAYAYAYPFIELALGCAYVFGIVLLATNIITVAVMLFSALGVYIQLRKGEKIMCACLGTVFKLPMTWVTLFEDLLMALMAALMILLQL